jgi:hypothetical protein
MSCTTSTASSSVKASVVTFSLTTKSKVSMLYYTMLPGGRLMVMALF